MTTEERIEKLETELAETKAGLAGAKRLTLRLMAGAVVVLVMCILFVAVRAMTGVAYSQVRGDTTKIIRANTFVLVDDQGRTRITQTVDTDGPGLVLLDEKGKKGARLGMTKFGPLLALYDDKGTSRADLFMIGDGPKLFMYDEKGTRRISLSVNKAGAALFLYDEKGEPRVPRAMLMVDTDGPLLTLYDEKGTGRAKLGVSQTETPDGKTTTYPESSLLLFGPDGKVIWQAPR